MNKKRKPSGSKSSQPLYKKMIQERDVMVPMRDGVHVCVDIYRPEASGKFPAILAFAPHNKDLQTPEVADAIPPQPAWSHLWQGGMEAGDTVPTANLFGKGHRICLEITSLDLPTGIALATNVEYIPYHVCGSKTVVHKIYHNERYPSHLLLPVIPNR